MQEYRIRGYLTGRLYKEIWKIIWVSRMRLARKLYLIRGNIQHWGIKVHTNIQHFWTLRSVLFKWFRPFYDAWNIFQVSLRMRVTAVAFSRINSSCLDCELTAVREYLRHGRNSSLCRKHQSWITSPLSVLRIIFYAVVIACSSYQLRNPAERVTWTSHLCNNSFHYFEAANSVFNTIL
jgi:hypothetical protein